MPRRSYNQTCSVAGALDLLGERWTLLLIRELLTGPKRYRDLLDGLRGIGTNLLAARLKSLAKDGLVARRRLPAPAGSTVYELTEAGWALEPMILELVRWGLRFERRPPPEALYRPLWSVVAMRAVFRPERAAGVRVSCEFRVGEIRFHAEVRDGRLVTGAGEGRDPDVVVTADEESYRRFESGATSEELEESGSWKLEGSGEALKRFVGCFALPQG